ncbi:hypothetical protein FB446DRAFT_531293 [Lentinula raphanica]|nr:hypothetical protein FB446DRAFT_531293 [Lentinula raphanica]
MLSPPFALERSPQIHRDQASLPSHRLGCEFTIVETILVLPFVLLLFISSPIMASIVRNVVNWSAQHGRSSPQMQSDMCEVCGKRPKFVEKGHKHPYCGRTCASKTSQSSGKSSSPTTPITVNTTTAKTCLIPGCPYDAKFQGYCDPEHAMEAVKSGQAQGCDMCHDQPVSINIRASRGSSARKLCVGCNRALTGGTQLKELGNRDSQFQDVRKRFIQEWNVQGEALPTVNKVYQVIVPRDHLSRYAAHKKTLHKAQEMRTYHASLMLCDLGTKGPFICERQGCGICSVLRSSFEAFAFGDKHQQGRFGPGIYTQMNPKLADKEATTITTSPYRIMVACDILVDADQEPISMDDEPAFTKTSDAIKAAYVIVYSM